MLKLLICLTSAVILAVLLLQLRQQRLELNFQVNRIHNQIENQQSRLWEQQLQIAVVTAPNAIAKTVGEQKLKMVPQTPVPASHASRHDSHDNPDAE
ncbi:MAG: hypothetical protein ACREJC_20825 [Tepidisphaeraceae bacterium]